MTDQVASYRRILKSSSIVGGASVINILIGLIRAKVLLAMMAHPLPSQNGHSTHCKKHATTASNARPVCTDCYQTNSICTMAKPFIESNAEYAQYQQLQDELFGYDYVFNTVIAIF